MKFSRLFSIRLAAACVGLALLGTAASASAQIVYLENFTTPNNNNNAFTEFNWGSIGSNGAVNTTASGTTVVLQSSNAAGPQTTLAGVNNTGTFATPTNGPAGSGFMYMATTSFDRALAFTRTEVEYFGATRTLSSSYLRGMSIQTGSSSAGNIRPAIMVGSTWYVLSSGLTAGTAANAAAFTGTPAQTQTWDATVFSGSNWAVIDTSVAGFSISGTTGALPTGNVNSVGFYYTTTLNTGTQRFDNFTLTAIPEPGKIMALGFGIFALVAVARRRRQNLQA